MSPAAVTTTQEPLKSKGSSDSAKPAENSLPVDYQM